MKRSFLFATALAAVAAVASGQIVEESIYTPNLTLEWYASPADLGDGYAARAGIGTQGKFYVIKQNDGVYVFDRNGQTKKIACSNAWVSISCDQAGHVYFRNDKHGWAGPEGAGWFVSEDAQFCVIDAATDEVIKENVPMIGGGKCRFDALPRLMGDMTKDFFELSAPVNATAQRIYNWLYNGLDEDNTFEQINIESYFKNYTFPEGEGGNSANLINTLGNCQHYQVDDVDYMAMLPNNNYCVTYSANGCGNNIAEMVYDEEEYAYVFQGKYFDTPNHSGVGGFCIFQYNGDNYIVYPSGQQVSGQPSADGFAVMKATMVDTPANSVPITEEDLNRTVAIKFGTDGLTSGNNWRGINVEPVEGEDGKFTIYFYSPGKSMQVWTLDLANSGLQNVVAESADRAAEYYNLQGIRVLNPANGIFIKVAGNQTSKVKL